MARRKLNGEIYGIIGATVSYNYKGRSCIRLRCVERKDKSPLIKQARLDFRVVMGLIKKMKLIIDEGFRFHTKDRSAYHSALSVNLNNYREAARLNKLDTLSWFSLSGGKLSIAIITSAILTPEKAVEITWSGVEPGRVCCDNDIVTAVLYLNIQKRVVKCDDSVTRQAGKVTINPGYLKQDEKIDVFLSFRSNSIRYYNTDKYASNSLWVKQLVTS